MQHIQPLGSVTDSYQNGARVRQHARIIGVELEGLAPVLRVSRRDPQTLVLAGAVQRGAVDVRTHIVCGTVHLSDRRLEIICVRKQPVRRALQIPRARLERGLRGAGLLLCRPIELQQAGRVAL